MKVLITGVAGPMGRLTAELLLHAGHEVLGIDRRPWPDAPRGIRVLQADIRKRPAEDVFRTCRPEAVIHMATVTHLTARFEERYRINLHGTRAVFEHCHTYGVRQVLFIGRHTVYGAGPDVPLYHSEDDPPIGGSTFPELGDLVAADLYAGTALWRWPELRTAVLRFVYTLGPLRSGTLASFLHGPRVPTVLGYDPLFQLMHERDAARAIVAALEANLRGIFNVAGPQPVPLGTLCRVTGRQAVAIPEPLYPRVTGRFGFPRLPRGATAHVKHPIVVNGDAFRDATGFLHEFSETQTMDAFRYAALPTP